MKESIIELDYTTYKGVDQCLDMRFAAPPLGEIRLSAPQDPLQALVFKMLQISDPYASELGRISVHL
ncbi:hypothetical protein BGW36DRAFT_434016 [Talaromyces proteolyticus]|uniref:Uncharacterized protein n=1 Tax=Talaromyces proteolyticus TaxID=1131652 RepID=A0AAD4KCR6_9EURO|nr:uncharacterized protein BGW36DRAFT_434016 [Talaromyces proteolyticus]KAH8688718.1 hypothetical protein BGW36DRAFT_434016 [Talaromyces proteolyticus]